MPTMRTTEVDMVQNDEALEINLDLLEERREQAKIHEAQSKAKWKNTTTLNSATQASNLEILCTGAMRPAIQKRARSLALSGKDHIKSNEASHPKESGKLSPKWEGPYKVTKALGNGACKLKDHSGKLLPQTWNIRNLKNVTCMKYKHPSHTSLVAKGAMFEFLFSHVMTFINE
nr:hypothetical protein [Tanacetum cinerariifolium]